MKAILPVAGLGTRFLPITKSIAKEMLPLVDKPLIHYAVEEAVSSGIKEIIFVVNSKKKSIEDYFTPNRELEEFLKKRNEKKLLEEVKNISNSAKFNFLIQRKANGDGDAVLKAKKLIGDKPFLVLFGDDIIESEPPCVNQLIDIFKNYRQPVIALQKVEKQKISSYGIIEGEKIADRLFKIKRIIEKPSLDKAPSDLAIVGRYVLTPEVFEILENLEPNKKGEIILADALEKMIDKGKTVYGYELKGKWYDCGDKIRYLKAGIEMALKDKKFGKEIKDFIKKIL